MVQRRRKILPRLAVLVALGVVGLFAVLPRADAHGTATAPTVAEATPDVLFTAAPVSSGQFGQFYAPSSH